MEYVMLRVDLSNRSTRIEEIPADIVRQYIGGRGLGAHYLYNFVPQGADPLGEENHLIFTVGPATGTGAFWSSKICLNTKSPYTGLYLNTLSSGNLPHQIRKAGFWVIDIYGASDSPVYLVINDGEVEFRDATPFWGMEVASAQEKMQAASGLEDASTLGIGPAGEGMMPYAGVFNEGPLYRTFGRGGAGSVMGSKMLKGFVVRGTQPVELADKEAFLEHKKKMGEILKKGPAKEWAEWWRRYETGADLEVLNKMGIIPTNNWQGGQFDGWRGICKSTTPMGWPEDSRACGLYCPTPGCRDTEVKGGPYNGARCDVEWEAIYAFGSTCGVDKMEAVIAANQLCDEFGIDTISTGVTIGFAMECFEKGLIGPKDTDGIDLRFGNDAAMIAVLRKIVNQEGFGKELARGTRTLSEKIKGSAAFAMHVKGLEMGGYECRDMHGQSLAFAVNARGGCHHGYGLPARAETHDGTQLEIEGKGEYVKRMATNKILRDAIPVCVFVRPYADSSLMAELVSALVGKTWTLEDMRLFGERVMCLERLFNMREGGITRKDDILPPRITDEPKPHGPNKGYDGLPLETLKDSYYVAMGYDLETGNPSDELVK
ncbi:MAG: aldehyde ferredoxin oxidoreductase C-terminal domain-containing protein, partial [Pseudomonadota bacterium]